MGYIEIILALIGVLLAAIIGAALGNWYKRPKPWLGLSSVDRDDTSLVEIPNELVEISSECRWCKALDERIALYHLREFTEDISESIEKIKEISKELNDLNPILKKSNLTDNEKLTVLRALLGNALIKRIIQAIISRGTTLKISKPDEGLPDLLKTEDLLKNPDIKEKVIILYNEEDRFVISAGEGFATQDDIEKTRMLAETFNKYILKEIKNIVDTIKNELAIDLPHCITLKDGLQSLLKSRRLKIKAKLSNIGSKPIHIKPYGLLEIKTRSNPLIIKVDNYRINEAGMEEFPRMIELIEGLASSQGVVSSRTPSEYKEVSEYIIVNPGTLVEIEFSTLDSTLEDATIDALENGILSSKIILVRTDTDKTIESDFQTTGIGISDKLKEDLLKLGGIE